MGTECRAEDGKDVENYLRVASEELSRTLVDIGIFPNVHGFYLLKELTLMMLFNNSRRNMSAAYGELSKRSGRSAVSIERNIRSAISQSHRLGQLIKLNSVLGVNAAEKNYCLTNSQLVNILAEFIHRKIR